MTPEAEADLLRDVDALCDDFGRDLSDLVARAEAAECPDLVRALLCLRWITAGLRAALHEAAA